MGLVGALLLLGCGRDGSTSAASDGSTAEGLLRTYIAAVNSGDVAGAMSQRCRPAQIPEADGALWSDQAKRLITANGPLGLGPVRVLPAGQGPIPRGGLRATAHFGFRLLVGGVLSPEALGALVDEDGRPRLCGYSTGVAGVVHDELAGQLADRGGTSTSVADLLPDSPGAGYRRLPELEPRTRAPVPVAQASRGWQRGDHGGSRLDAYRFSSRTEAAAEALRFAEDPASDGVERIEVPEAGGAVGIRFLAFAWIWVQPPARGPFIDQVVILMGDATVVIAVSDLPTVSDHHEVLALAADVVRRAGS